jgi:hypothetical protein
MSILCCLLQFDARRRASPDPAIESFIKQSVQEAGLLAKVFNGQPPKMSAQVGLGQLSCIRPSLLLPSLVAWPHWPMAPDLATGARVPHRSNAQTVRTYVSVSNAVCAACTHTPLDVRLRLFLGGVSPCII